MSETNLADQVSVAEAEELTTQKLLSLGVLWPAEVDRICAEETRTQFLIEGFLPTKSIAIVAGDSTIGKVHSSASLPFVSRRALHSLA